MGILERLRPTPRWKHADPAVRSAAVYDLGPDDGEALRALARDDAEARVRRAAVSRLDDPAVLGEVARTDPDEEVRMEAIRHLAGLATEGADVARTVAIVQDLLALARSREVVVIVRESRHADVRAAVVDVVTDQKALGSISRHAPDGQTRLRALARITDKEELVSVALKSEQTDVAVAALEHIGDADALTAIAQRARNKVAARRARTKQRQIEEAAQPRHEEAARVSPEDQLRAMDLLGRAEGVVALGDPAEAGAALSAVRLAWAELQADVDLGEDLGQQFEAACDAAREAIAEREREHAAEMERARELAREPADRLAIVGEIEALEAH
jgi:hypothetical protein